MERKILSVLDFDLMCVTTDAVLAEIFRSVKWFDSTHSRPEMSARDRLKYVIHGAYPLIDFLLSGIFLETLNVNYLTRLDLNYLNYSPVLISVLALCYCLDITEKSIDPSYVVAFPCASDHQSGGGIWWDDLERLTNCKDLKEMTSCYNWVKEGFKALVTMKNKNC